MSVLLKTALVLNSTNCQNKPTGRSRSVSAHIPPSPDSGVSSVPCSTPHPQLVLLSKEQASATPPAREGFGLRKPERLQHKACSRFEFRGQGWNQDLQDWGWGSKFPASVTSSDKWGQTRHFHTKSKGSNGEQGHPHPALSRVTQWQPGQRECKDSASGDRVC